MNEQLQQYARNNIKAALAKLPPETHRIFKLMYARDGGRRSAESAVAMDINVVVDLMPASQLDWAMQQVQDTLDDIA